MALMVALLLAPPRLRQDSWGCELRNFSHFRGFLGGPAERGLRGTRVNLSSLSRGLGGPTFAGQGRSPLPRE
eukprot:9463666-Pyramimonas_sp.AAC.1